MTQIPQNPQVSDKMTLAEFEQRLPEFFSTGTGKISDDPRFQAFLLENPDSAALVRDLEYIAAAAGQLLHKEDDEPSDSVWQNIQSGLKDPASDIDGVAAKPAGSL